MVHTSIAVRVRPDPRRTTKCPAPFRGLPIQVEVDHFFEPSSTQEQIFSSCVGNAIDDILQGKDACVLVYGAPTSGKTHTLVGHAHITPFAAGIISQAVESILSHLQIVPRDKYQLQATLSGLTSKQDACIHDLLDPSAPSTPLRETGAQGAAAKLSVMPLDSMDDAHAYLQHCLLPQPQASSRPSSALAASSPKRKPVQDAGSMHVMFNMELITRPGQPDEHVATLSFVELIGPETKDSFGMTARKPDEALQRQLARSYAALASVLLALRSETPAATPTTPHRQPADLPHVPWRDSPLTKWLRPVLTSIHNLIIIATVDPSADAAQDTLATLTYVSRFRTPGPGVSISAPLPGQVEWEPPSRPGSTQPPAGRRGVAATGARQPRSASATPRVSTPPPGPGGGRPSHFGPCHTSQSRWLHPDLTPRSQPLAQPSGPRSACRADLPHIGDAEHVGHTYQDVSVCGAVPDIRVSRQPGVAPATAFTGGCLGLGEPRSPGTDSGGSQVRKGPCASLAYAHAGAVVCDQDCSMLQGSPPQQRGDAGRAGRQVSALDGRGMELLAMLRRRGVGIREEALLEQLLQDFSQACDEAADARAYRERAEQRIRSLEAALEEQAKDRAAAVVVIEQLQKELREARCECVVLTDQRRYFEERAAAAGAAAGCPGQAGPARGDPDAGPGLVPVQELIEARAQAADARAGAFAAQQEVQAAEEHAVELVRQLRERMRFLAGQEKGEPGGGGAVGPASPGMATARSDDCAASGQAKSCVAVLQEGLGVIQGLAGVQQQVQWLAQSKKEALRRAEAVEAAGGAKAVASAETAANAAAAEAALERAKSRDLAARAAQLEGECATAVTRSTAAAEEAGRYRSTAGEFRKQAKDLEGQLAAAHAELQVAREHERRARQADAAEAELRLERARHSDLEAGLATAQQELSQTKKQTAELHELNDALTRELDGVRAELAISQRAHADAADGRATVEMQLLALQECALGLERDAAALREADRHRSGELRQSSEAASALREQRNSLQERLAEVQEHLSRAVADTDRFRSQASSRDSLLCHMWEFASSMEQLMRAAKDAATEPAAQNLAGKEGAAAEPELPGSWDDPANQERLLAATTQVRSAATPMLKELQEVVQLRVEAAELHLARRTSAASEESLQAHVSSLEAQLHDCQAQLQQAQQQLSDLKPRLAASTKKQDEAAAAAATSAELLQQLQQQNSSAEAQLAAAHSVAEAAAEDAAAAAHARGAAQDLTVRLQAVERELEVREAEIVQLVGELQEATATLADAEATAQAAVTHSQQLAMTASAAQEALERMQAANQELVQRYDRKASTAAAEESRLQAEVEERRAEAARLQARAEEVERRARGSAVAAQECERLREELQAVTEERRVALERQRVAEADARDARHETERLQEEVRRLEGERRSAAADTERLQRERAAAAETQRTLDESFDRLDRARERTRAALSSHASRGGLTAPATEAAVPRAGSVARSMGARSLRSWSNAGLPSWHDAGAHGGTARRPQSSAGALTVPAGRMQRGVAREGCASECDPFSSTASARGGAGRQLGFADRMKPDVEARLAGLDPLAKADNL